MQTRYTKSTERETLRKEVVSLLLAAHGYLCCYSIMEKRNNVRKSSLGSING